MTNRDRIAVLVVVSVAALAGFWFLVLGPKRSEASDLAAKVTQEHTRLDTARAGAADGEKARAAYGSNYATVAKLGKAVPADDDIASLLYQVQTISHGNHIDFRSMTLDSGAAPAAAAPAPVATPGAQVAQANSDGQSGGTGATTPSPAGTPSTSQVAVASLPPGATVGPAGFPVMPFSFTFDGDFFRMENFLRALARATKVSGSTIRVNGRLLTIDSFDLSASREGFPKVQAQIKANAFLTPPDEGLLGGATPQSPTAGATTPSTGSTTPAAPAAIASLPGVTK